VNASGVGNCNELAEIAFSVRIYNCLTQSPVQSLLMILDIEVEVTKKHSDFLVLAPGSLLGEWQPLLLLGSLANDGNVPLANNW
jgi:hypothetical protein